MFRNDKFTGERGKYNSVFNELVRQLGKSNVKQLQQYNKDTYNEICNDISELASASSSSTTADTIKLDRLLEYDIPELRREASPEVITGGGFE